MTDCIKIKQGLDIPIKGRPEAKLVKSVTSKLVAVKPTDFRNLKPRLLVKEGDRLLAGTPVFCDKMRPEVVFASPVSGTVAEIVRGEKRKLLEIRITADDAVEYATADISQSSLNSGKAIIDVLVKHGLWPFIQQRPYGIIANPEDKPKNIFVSGFTTSPLGGDYEYTLRDDLSVIQKGFDALNRILPGGVHLSLPYERKSGSVFHKITGVNFHYFSGPHPAGNVGVQINRIAPVNKGEVVWTVSLPDVAVIGRFLTKGNYDVTRTIAVAGPRAAKPGYVKCISGMCMKDIADLVGPDANKERADLPVRYVSGDILTGTNVGADGFLGFYDSTVSLITEGAYNELFGWAKPFRFKKFSFAHTYFSWLFGKKEYDMDTNTNGGVRAFVVHDIYAKVFPMDIYPVYLLKAILAGDIDKMEQYGIYEVVEEDFALCEYVCPSKIDIQAIVTEGIDLMLKEMA